MLITRQVLSEGEIHLLSELLHSTWVNISGEGFVESNLCMDEVRAESDKSALQFSLIMEPLNIDGEVDIYPQLHIERASQISTKASIAGNIYFHGQGEVIQEIYVLRETLVSIRNGEKFFENIADISIAVHLESLWISFTRDSQFSEVFIVQRTATREEIELPDTVEEWGPDLMEQYHSTTEWIRVGES